MKNKIKTKLSKIALAVVQNRKLIIPGCFTVFILLIIMNIISIKFSEKVVDTELEQTEEIEVQDELILFPEPDQVYAESNPKLFDAFHSIFGFHFNNELLKISYGGYKLVVLDEGTNFMLYDDYVGSALDSIYAGQYGVKSYIIQIDQTMKKELKAWREGITPDYTEEYTYTDGRTQTFSFYILDENEFDYAGRAIKTISGGIVIPPRNEYIGDQELLESSSPMDSYFNRFGFPIEWCKVVLDETPDVDLEDDLWKTYNINQPIICSKLDENGNIMYKEDDQMTYTIVRICSPNEIIMVGGNVGSINAANNTLAYNNYQSLEEGLEFTKELYKEYDILKFN